MDSYFSAESNAAYENMRAYMNAVKGLFINQYLSKRRVLDLGIGRGQDINKYTHAGVTSVQGIDLDVHALQELVYRRLDFAKTGKRFCPLQLALADLGAADLKRLKELSQGVNAVCTFFSFHYYHQNRALYEMLSELPRGAVFIVSVVCKEYLLKLLGENTAFKSEHYQYRLRDNRLTIKLPFAS